MVMIAEIVFAEAVAELIVNGQSVAVIPTVGGFAGDLSEMVFAQVNQLRFRFDVKVQRPFVWLHGRFRVASEAPFKVGPNGTIVTSGPLILRPPTDEFNLDLLQAGFPFLCSPLVVETNFQSTTPVHSLQFCGIKADAARITLNGLNLGWIWGPDWRIAVEIRSGMQTLRLEVIPSSYNYFGPHHYFAGDHHVISPDQFLGKRNFADSADAPSNTLVREWHFRPFDLPPAISSSR